MKTTTLEKQLKRYPLPVPSALNDQRIEAVVRDAAEKPSPIAVCSMAVQAIRRNLCILAGTAAAMLISLHIQQFMPGTLNSNSGVFYDPSVTGILQGTVITSITCNTGTVPEDIFKLTRPSRRIQSAQNGNYYTQRNSWFSISN
jgi:hypothetical protein